MFRYHKQLEGFSLELETEYTKFQNTCENLLQDLVPPLHVQQMVNPRSVSDGQALWRSPKLRHTLNEQLRERTVNSFLKNVEAMEEIITELRRTFPTEPDGDDGSGLVRILSNLAHAFDSYNLKD